MGAHAGAREFDVPPDWTLPRLGRRIVPDGGRVESSDEREASTVHDTDAGDLATAGIRLARVTVAGAEPVWRLVVGGNTSTFPAPGRSVPAEIRDLLLGVRSGGGLRGRGRVETDRTVHRVLDADGAERGTIALESHRRADPVAGGTVAGGTSVEVVDEHRVVVAGWTGPFLDAATRRLRKTGATEVGAAGTDAVTTPETVGAALRAYLVEQHAAMLDADLALRFGEDAVHRFRVAIRRVRSALRVVDVADPEAVAGLDGELRWLSEVLGAVRDREVLREHLFADVDPDPALAAAYTHAERVLDDEDTAARTNLTRVMRGRRYLALLRTLRSWREDPPFTSAAERPAERLGTYARKANRRLDRRLAAASGSAEKLHRARKAAKRARYVADLAGPFAGKHAASIAAHAKALQTRLGDHQDCVMATEFLARAARTAAPDAAFGCGVLWAREQRRADDAARAAEAG